MSQQPPSAVTNADIEDKYDEYMAPIWKSLDVPIRRAEGCTLEDFEGNEYLDSFSGISVTNAGHRNEAIVDAAKDQLDEFIHGCTYLHPHQPVADLAEKIAEITPGNIQKSFFGNSGTEAVEGAVKLARKYTGSKEVIALEMAFHGRTLGSLALTGNKAYKDDMAPTINDVAHTAAPYSYRCAQCDDTCTASCANNLEHVIDTHTSGDLAAVIVEPVMGEGGIIVPPEGWLEQVKEITNDRGGLLIADEVQTGYGRTGKMWASEHFDVEPDIISHAKGIASGLPLGVFSASEEIADAFEAGDHLSTFGGNPVICAAALAAIEEYEDGLVDNSAEQGEWLSDQLADIEANYDVVGETRGLGLMQGVELVDPSESGPMDQAPAPDKELAKRVGKRMREEHGIIIGVGGFYGNVMRVQPPLTIDREQLSRIVEALDESIAAEAGN